MYYEKFLADIDQILTIVTKSPREIGKKLTLNEGL